MGFMLSKSAKPPVPETLWTDYINRVNATFLITSLISFCLVRLARRWLTNVAAAEGENVVIQKGTKTSYCKCCQRALPRPA